MNPDGPSGDPRNARTSTSRRGVSRYLTILLLALLSIGLVGCQESLEAPAQSVQTLLEIRADRSQDASAYAEHLSSADLAIELANSAMEESMSVDPPTPSWSTPYVAVETSSTAEVVVVWSTDEAFPDWPLATVFQMELSDGQWFAVDALPVESEDEIPDKPE